MSGINRKPKRQSSPSLAGADSETPKKRCLSGDNEASITADKVKPKSSSGDHVPLIGNTSLRSDIESCVSKWKGIGENNILEKLSLDRRFVDVSDFDSFKDFYPDRLWCKPEDQKDLDTFFKILDKCIDFDVKDAPVKIPHTDIICQYGGYNNSSPAAEQDFLTQFEKCFEKLNHVAQTGKWTESETTVKCQETSVKIIMELRLPKHLVKYLYYALDFIGESTRLLTSPTYWLKPAYEDLFCTFCRISGIHLQNAGRERPRCFEVFGVPVTGKPDMRLFVPVDRENWWRQKPVTKYLTVSKVQTLSAVVEVKMSAPSEGSSVEEAVSESLGQVVGEMLAELLSPAFPVVSQRRTHMLGILVMSTQVYFVKLHVPVSLMDMYRQSSPSPRVYENTERGTVYVTQGFDFMKKKPRLELLKILHRIGTVQPVP